MQPWTEQLIALLQQLEFWIAVVASLFLWWVFGVIVARVLYSMSGHPLGAVRAAAGWATVLTACAAVGFGWYRWGNYVGAAALGLAALFATLATAAICTQLEPQVTAE